MRPEDEMAVYEPDEREEVGIDMTDVLKVVAVFALVGVALFTGFLLYRIFSA